MNRRLVKILGSLGLIGIPFALGACHVHPDVVCGYTKPHQSYEVTSAEWGRDPVWDAEGVDHYRCESQYPGNPSRFDLWCVYEKPDDQFLVVENCFW